MVINSFKRVFAILMLSSLTTLALAEAPVYDVDNYPPQFDNQSDAAAVNPPPAPEAQTDAGAQSLMSAPKPSETEQAQNNQTEQVAPPPENQDAVLSASQNLSQSLPIDQRIRRVEQQILNMQHADASSKMNSLQNEVQSLRGQVEQLNHQLQQMQSQQKSMYSDLDKRIIKQQSIDAANTSLMKTKKIVLNKKNKEDMTTSPIPAADEPPTDDQPVVAPKPVATTTKTITTVAKKPSVNDEQDELKMYQNAYDLIKDSKFDQAIGVLQSMLNKYPSGQSAANAHYWLGELYGLQKKNDQASTEFATVVRSFPDSPKVSDAEVKLGMIYASQFKWVQAKATFRRVINHYPGTTSARLASQQLKAIRSDGH